MPWPFTATSTSCSGCRDPRPARPGRPAASSARRESGGGGSGGGGTGISVAVTRPRRIGPADGADAWGDVLTSPLLFPLLPLSAWLVASALAPRWDAPLGLPAERVVQGPSV